MPNIIEVKDFHAPELDVYARLTENELLQLRPPKHGLFIAESPRVIERALDAGCVPVSLLLERKHIDGEAKGIIVRCEGVPVYTADFDVLTRLTGFKLTRGALCAMERPTLPTPQAVCRGARRIAVLENVMNPTNVGAIFRNGAALHMDGVILTSACSNPLYRRAVRVSMGTVFQVPWAFFEGAGQRAADIGILKELGFVTVAMALKADSLSVADPRLKAAKKLAIVLGNEGDGLTEDTVNACDYVVQIPMRQGVDSLNVAAASAVAFWELGGY